MVKHLRLLTIAIVLIMVLSGCSKAEIPLQENTKNVEVQVVQEEVTPISLSYSGVVKPDESKGLSFKKSGKIMEIYVDENDTVEPGSVIALMDQEVPSFELKASQANLDAAKMDYEKAKEAYIFAEDQLSKTEALYKAEAVSQNDYNKAKLTTQTAKITMDQAEVKYKQLNEDYNLKLSNFEDTKLVADISGHVLAVNYKEGDLVQAGMPIITMDNDQKKIVVGISEKDLQNIQVGMDVTITYQGNQINSKVTIVSRIPDVATRTYKIEIPLTAPEIPLGAVVDTNFKIGEHKAVWVPLNAVLASTIDYVFIARDDIAVKKAVELLEVEGTRVRVEGLEIGDKVIVKGMKSIKEGNNLNIIN
ncbi:MAG: efflux RND transporter periplasmic adaptor subunit [Desulfitobacterium sp.]